MMKRIRPAELENTWITSDHHFGHENIIKFCDRPFEDVDEMNKELIDNWNDRVEKYDTVYHLGDFTLGNLRSFDRYVRRLNGNISIIPGGHDHRWLFDYDEEFFSVEYENKISILPPLFTLEIEQEDDYPLPVVMCHYAMRVWDRSHYGSAHFYGHSHGNLESRENSMDVGVDCHNYAPIRLEEAIENVLEKE